MDLSTTYLGFKLDTPFMPGGSPLVDDLATVKRLEDAGASAIVLRSLFEEQIVREQVATFLDTETHHESFAEASTYLPHPDQFRLGPDTYLEHVRKISQAVGVPVIASLNGTTLGGWLHYAELMQQAGADALELNVYLLGTDPGESGQAIEDRTVEMIRAIKQKVSIPVAVKLSPYYTCLSHFAKRLDDAGVDGLVLFNRFYQADIDVEELAAVPTLRLSSPQELLLRITWLAVLSSQVRPPLALSGGVHGGLDAIKATMAGASAIQVVSALLRNGPGYLQNLIMETKTWLEVHEYESLAQAQGSMNLVGCPDPKAYERANYMQVLAGWKQR